MIKKYKRDVKQFDIPALVHASEHFSGAEIDNAFKDAMFEAFSAEREVTNDFVIKEFESVVPQSKINEASISQMRDAVEGRLRLASGENKIATATNKLVSAGTRKVKA